MTVIEPDVESFRKPVLAKVPAQFEAKWGKGTWDKLLDALTERIRRTPRQAQPASIAARARERVDEHLVALADRLVQAVAVVVHAGAARLRGARRRLAPAQRAARLDRRAGADICWSGPAFAGWMIALRRRAHIRITMLIDRLPARARARAPRSRSSSASWSFGVLLLRYGFGLIERNLDVEAISAADHARRSSTCRCLRSALALDPAGARRGDRGRARARAPARPSRRRPAYDAPDAGDPRRLGRWRCCSACRCSPRWGSRPSPSSRSAASR